MTFCITGGVKFIHLQHNLLIFTIFLPPAKILQNVCVPNPL